MNDLLVINYEDMLKDDFICPLCNKPFLCTQCGPTNKPKTSWLMQKLPSAKMFKKFCRIHDISYNIAPIKGFLIENIPKLNGWYINKGDKVSCDVLFYELMINYVKTLPWYKRFIYKRVAKLYYKAVRDFGKDSFIHNHNKEV